MVSIIVPVHNAEEKISGMLDSILCQVYTNYECILVDDGSTDSSLQICREYVERDCRFHSISQKNSGVSAARNQGLKNAKGEYITFLDADDKIPENYLSVLVKRCETADIAVCDTIVIQDGKEVYRFTHPDDILTKTQALNALLTRTSINSGPCCKIFRRELVSDLRFPPLRTYEDILFVQQAFARANSIATTNKTAYFYIQNSAGAMSRLHKHPSIDIVTASEQLLQFILKNKELSPQCVYIIISHVFQYVLLIVRNSKDYCTDFLKAAQTLYKKYIRLIVGCKAIPWKEKLVFLLFAYGWVYQNKNFSRLKF